jgi:hypothetical protein
MALSPDGRSIVFAATGSDGKSQLWIRPLDAALAYPLTGTQDGQYPFWSPDSRWVGFFANGKLKKIDTHGVLKMLVSRIPRRKDLPIKIGSVPMDTLEELERASKMILKKASSGRLSWGEALEVSAAIETRRRVLETRDLERRVSTLEDAGGSKA